MGVWGEKGVLSRNTARLNLGVNHYGQVGALGFPMVLRPHTQPLQRSRWTVISNLL